MITQDITTIGLAGQIAIIHRVKTDVIITMKTILCLVDNGKVKGRNQSQYQDYNNPRGYNQKSYNQCGNRGQNRG